MIKTLIIDDEPLACSIIQEFLSKRTDFEVVAVCNDGFTGLKAIATHQPDLIFLDVQMPKITGFELLELLDEKPAVIFTTAFDEYAIQAFEANAVDYLLKPFSEQRFTKALEKFLEKPQRNFDRLMPSKTLDRVVIRDGSRIRIVPLTTIYWLEADDDYVKIKTTEGSFLKKDTLKNFEDQLPEQLFVRVHRTHLINVQFLTRIDPYEKTSHLALLKNGDKIPVSKQGYLKLKSVLGW